MYNHHIVSLLFIWKSWAQIPKEVPTMSQTLDQYNANSARTLNPHQDKTCHYVGKLIILHHIIVNKSNEINQME
jgi:hypothetical protein